MLRRTFLSYVIAPSSPSKRVPPVALHLVTAQIASALQGDVPHNLLATRLPDMLESAFYAIEHGCSSVSISSFLSILAKAATHVPSSDAAALWDKAWKALEKDGGIASMPLEYVRLLWSAAIDMGHIEHEEGVRVALAQGVIRGLVQKQQQQHHITTLSMHIAGVAKLLLLTPSSVQFPEVAVAVAAAVKAVVEHLKPQDIAALLRALSRYIRQDREVARCVALTSMILAEGGRVKTLSKNDTVACLEVPLDPSHPLRLQLYERLAALVCTLTSAEAFAALRHIRRKSDHPDAVNAALAEELLARVSLSIPAGRSVEDLLVVATCCEPLPKSAATVLRMQLQGMDLSEVALVAEKLAEKNGDVSDALASALADRVIEELESRRKFPFLTEQNMMKSSPRKKKSNDLGLQIERLVPSLLRLV